MSNLFVETDDIARAVEQIANPLEHLVGEGKKFKTTEELAKGKLYSDLYVPKLENDIKLLKEAHAQLEAELEASQSRAKETITMVNEATTNSSTNDTNVTNTIKPEDISSLVAAELNKAKDSEKRQTNVDYVRRELEKNLGDKYAEHMKQLADEYGAEYLTKLAEENPKVFLKLAGSDTNHPTSKPSTNLFSPPSSSINISAKLDTAPKQGAKYWSEMRKKDSKYFNSPEGYRARLEDLTRLGDDYFKH